MVRRKIEMELVKDKSARMVTFSKRRSGLFKKASELSILCGAQVGVVGFTPGDKPFSFGYPSIEAVTSEFLHKGHHHEPGESSSKNGNKKVHRLNKRLEDQMKQLQEKKKEKETLDKALSKGNVPVALDELDLEELQKLKASLTELREDLKSSLVDMEAASALLLLAQKPVIIKRQKKNVRFVK